MSEAYPQPVRDPRRPFIASPFTRLARTHALSVGGDALFTVGLAGTIFFAVSPKEAPAKIGLYLLLTFAPFAVAAPFIGPVLDRVKGGRRWMIVAAIGLRAVLCVLIVRDLNSVYFYVEAFLMLVFQKAYLISRASVVPTTVRSDHELVEANSKLAMLSGMAAIVAGGPGLILLKLGGNQYGPQLAVGLGAVVYATGAVFATRLPRVQVAAEKPTEVEKLELRSAGIRLAASAMALMRCAVGFLVLLLALSYKNHQLHLWAVSGAVVAAQAGVLVGSLAGAAAAQVALRGPHRGRIAGRHPAGWPDRRTARRRGGRLPAVVPAGRHLGHGQAGLRRPGAARRPRCQPGSLLRPVRDQVPAGLGGGCGHPAAGAVPAGGGLPGRGRGHGRRPGLVLAGPTPGGRRAPTTGSPPVASCSAGACARSTPRWRLAAPTAPRRTDRPGPDRGRHGRTRPAWPWARRWPWPAPRGRPAGARSDPGP